MPAPQPPTFLPDLPQASYYPQHMHTHQHLPPPRTNTPPQGHTPVRHPSPTRRGCRGWKGKKNAGYKTNRRVPEVVDLGPATVDAVLGPGSRLQVEMLLAPFLGTRDLLRLSEAAKWLLPYRNQLGGVKIGWWFRSRTAAMLAHQRRLHTIRLEATESLASLVASLKGGLAWHPGRTVRRLILGSSLALDNAAPALPGADPSTRGSWAGRKISGGEGIMRELWAGLNGGCCPELTALEMPEPRLVSAGATYLRQGLSTCPIRALRLSVADKAATEALASAIKWGVYPTLITLDVTAVGWARAEGCEVIIAAMHAHPRRGLRGLTLRAFTLTELFIRALHAGAFRWLTGLTLSSVTFHTTDAGAFIEALEGGACPKLRSLYLHHMALTPRGIPQLCQALGDWTTMLRRLEDLELRGNHISDQDLVMLGETLRGGGGVCPLSPPADRRPLNVVGGGQRLVPPGAGTGGARGQPPVHEADSGHGGPGRGAGAGGRGRGVSASAGEEGVCVLGPCLRGRGRLARPDGAVLRRCPI
jgi:hypothetical protein